MSDCNAACRRCGAYPAAFCGAFGRTMQHEKGYSHDPDDPGGMTYMGISRVWYPGWPGWMIIDSMLSVSDHPVFGHNEELQDLVRRFYLEEFWYRLHCDWLAGISVDVALEVFDTAVNLSHRQAIEILQEALNLLNRNELAYPDLLVDGLMGRKTRAAVKDYAARYDFELLVKLMNHLQAEQYVIRMRRDKRREKWVGWFART